MRKIEFGIFICGWNVTIIFLLTIGLLEVYFNQGLLPHSDNYCLTVLVEDTGFSGRLSLPENDFFDDSMYDDQGVCIDTERAAKVGAICYARVTDYHGQDALELYQQISGTAPMEHFGYLVSVVTWEAEGYKVLEQRLESET